MKIDRASAELRRGGIIMLRLSNGEAGLFRAVELMRNGDTEKLVQLGGSGAMLVLTDNRITSLGRSLRDTHSCATIPVANQKISTLVDIAISLPDANVLAFENHSLRRLLILISLIQNQKYFVQQFLNGKKVSLNLKKI